MLESGDEKRHRIRQFLDSLDLDSETWKDQVIDYICAEKIDLNRKEDKRKRIATFSVGEDLEDEIGELVIDNLNQKEQKDAETQCIPITTDFEQSEVPAAELSVQWARKEYVSPGDAIRLLNLKLAKLYELDSRFDVETAISIRREFVSRAKSVNFSAFPYQGYDYKYVTNACCENVIGYIPIPVGVAGPLIIKHKKNAKERPETVTVFVPLATTEGALIASVNRGCSLLCRAGGVSASVTDDKMTRAPVVAFDRAEDAVELKEWLEDEENYQKVKEAFEGTSNYCKLKKISPKVDGNSVYLKFYATTGDAMGMNMVSKACSGALNHLKTEFPDMKVLALSGNYCVDKKPAAINWIEGRGKSVVVDATISAKVINDVLKTTPKKMAEAAQAKLSNGSSMAGCFGGNNAQAANVVAAIFLATGQDAAQIVSSSMCQTRMEVDANGSLYVSCTMPCIEAATVGGGTILPPQNELLKMLGCAGRSENGENAKFLAKVIASTVLAGELSLMGALCTDTLVSSHMKLNRSQLKLYGPTTTSEEKSQPALTLAPERQYFRTKRNSERASCSNIL